jgi:hypothetical protein
LALIQSSATSIRLHASQPTTYAGATAAEIDKAIKEADAKKRADEAAAGKLILFNPLRATIAA